jgi:hypothetical protein
MFNWLAALASAARNRAYAICALVAIAVVSPMAYAADIKLIEKKETPPYIVMTGEIVSADVGAFMAIAAPLERAIVVFEDSPGGSLDAALAIGRIIHARQYMTAVDSSSCMSACAAIWIAGAMRISGKKAQIGFHAAAGRHEADAPREITGDSNASFGAYMKELSLGDAFIRFATYAPIDDVQLLNKENATANGLIVEWLGLDEMEKRQKAYAWHNQAVSQRFSATPNLSEAVRLYKLAADANYAGSQNNLGDLYETGTGVPKIPPFAIYWYARSAERGEPTAYLSLSTLLPQLSSEPDVLMEATKFAILAVRELGPGKNKAAAEKALTELKAKLTAEQLEHVEQLAKAWTPLYSEPFHIGDKPVAKQIEEKR